MLHTIDSYPISDKSPVYVNEPWLVDLSKEPQTLKDMERFRNPEDYLWLISYDSGEQNLRSFFHEVNHQFIGLL